MSAKSPYHVVTNPNSIYSCHAASYMAVISFIDACDELKLRYLTLCRIPFFMMKRKDLKQQLKALWLNRLLADLVINGAIPSLVSIFYHSQYIQGHSFLTMTNDKFPDELIDYGVWKFMCDHRVRNLICESYI